MDSYKYIHKNTHDKIYISNSLKNYDKLIPKDISKKSEAYKLLKEALLDPTIKNIGITGSYGSGKSSLIESVKNDFYIKNKKNISISLLNFTSNDLTPEKKYLELEKRILQQIFYQVDSNEIPLSSFHKIDNSYKFWKGFIALIILSSIFVFGFYLKESQFKVAREIVKRGELINLFSTSFTYLYLEFFAICCLIAYSLEKIKKFKIKKFSPIKSLEFEATKDKEYLDLYMEDIIYFFRSLKIEILYIEDLDRCENIEIFIKLRELNTLLNKNLNKKLITFVYAVKDELFTDTQRSKFFDFIIPVIPVLNATNSEGILSEKLSFDFISPDEEAFLSQIFKYITDMRLGLNICNEYKLYRKTFTSSRFRSIHLLSIIVFKNIYPEEFSKANFNEGLLYRIFNMNKSKIINFKIAEIEKTVIEKEKLVQTLQEKKYNDIETLKKVYTGLIINDLYLHYIQIKNIDLNFNSSINLKYSYYNSYTWTNIDKEIPYEDMDKTLNFDYSIQKKLIEDSHSINKINNEIFELKKELKRIKNISLEKLLITITSEEQKKILEVPALNDINNLEKVEYDYALKSFLFSNGYINEGYRGFLSEFKEGELTAFDNSFVKAVFSNFDNYHDWYLDNPDIVLSNIKNCDRKSIINTHLINFELKNSSIDKSEYLDKVFSLIDLSSRSMREEFLFLFLEVENTEAFFTGLFNKKNNLWNEIIEFYEKNEIYTIIELIINSCSNSNILKLCNTDLKNYLENNDNILTLRLNSKNFNTLISKLKIKFNHIPKTINMDLFESLKNNNSYSLTKNNIENLFYFENNSYIEEGKFYTSICDNLFLKNYIDKNIEDFITNIYINLANYSKEHEQLLTELIETKIDNNVLKEKILSLNLNKFTNIQSLSKNLYKFIAKNNKIEKSISNINTLYHALSYGLEMNDILELINTEDSLIFNGTIDSELLSILIQDNCLPLKILKPILEETHDYFLDLNENQCQNLNKDIRFYIIEKNILIFNQNLLQYLEQDELNTYINNNQDVIITLIKSNDFSINEDDTIIWALLKNCPNILEYFSQEEIITFIYPISDYKIPKKYLEQFIKKVDLNLKDVINIIDIQIQYYQKEIFSLLGSLHPNFNNKRDITLENCHTWINLATILKKYNLITSFRQLENNKIKMVKKL